MYYGNWGKGGGVINHSKSVSLLSRAAATASKARDKIANDMLMLRATSVFFVAFTMKDVTESSFASAEE